MLLVGRKLTLIVDVRGEGARTVLRAALTAAARTTDPPPLPVVMDDAHGSSGYVSEAGEEGMAAAERVLRAAGWEAVRR